MKISSVLVVALFTSQISAIQLESNNLIESGCPDSESIPIKIKHKKSGGKKLKNVLKAIASEEEDDEPKVSVVRVPAPAGACAAKEAATASCDAKKAATTEADSEKVGKKAGKEAQKAVEKALKK